MMLFEPMKIRGISFKNRIVISPMCQYSSVDGFANDWHLSHLGSRAAGGAALVIQEATAISPEGRITLDDMGLWKDEQIVSMKRINKFIKNQSAVSGIQLAHAGRKASTTSPWKGGITLTVSNGGWVPLAPSSIPFHDQDDLPHSMTLAEITTLIDDFKNSAERALNADFEVIEIHAAHGYLIHSFLSPLSNQRSDEYGGSFENRTRLLLEIVKQIRTVWPEHLPLFIRISASDYSEGGWDLSSSIRLAEILKNSGVDLIDCSSGGLITGVRIPLGPGYQVSFSEEIRKKTGILTGAVGLITTSLQAEEILKTGKSDFIMIARESLRDPNFPLRAARELGVDTTWPKQYTRAKV